MRGEHGQTAAETLGALLVVGVIVAGVAGTDAGGRIRTEGERLVCAIAHGGNAAECAAEPAAPNGGDRRISGLQGPPLGDGVTLPVLPWPGTSVTVQCTIDKRQPETCVPKGQPGVSVQASGELKLEHTGTALDADGCAWATFSLETKLQLTANAEAKGTKAGGQLQAYLGKATKYQVMVNPANAREISAHRRKPPNPVDPRSLMKGESITLSEDYYAGIKAKATYRQLQVEMGYDEGKRVSSAVKRIDASTVRVVVGDEEFVKSAAKLGFKLDVVSLSLANSKELSGGKLHSVDIDISTKEGWNAYQAFLQTGRLPAKSATGTRDPMITDSVKYTDTTQIEAKFGTVTVGARGANSEGRWTTTRKANGDVETTEYVRYNQTSFAIKSTRDRNGRESPPTYVLMLHDLHPSYIEGLYARTGQRMPLGGEQRKDMLLRFTEPQLRSLQRFAREKVRDRRGINISGFWERLAKAKTPRDMLVEIYRTGFYSQNNVIEELAGLLAYKQKALPATIITPDPAKC